MRLPVSLLVALAVSVCGLARAQTASFTFFGSGCTTNPLTPKGDFKTLGLPRIGTSFTLRYLGGNRRSPCRAIGCVQQPILVLGVSNTSFNGVPLPFRYRSSCPLRVSGEVVLPMPFDPARGRFTDTVTVPVPRDPTLLGQSFFVQWLTAHAAIPLASSQGARGRIGI